jgi:Protein of unknown function (DUF3684)
MRFLALTLNSVSRRFFKGYWKEGTSEGKLLLELGLRTHPPLNDLLWLAAYHSDKVVHGKALSYLIDNFKTYYRDEYNPSRIFMAFLPTREPGKYSTPMVCRDHKMNVCRSPFVSHV